MENDHQDRLLASFGTREDVCMKPVLASLYPGRLGRPQSGCLTGRGDRRYQRDECGDTSQRPAAQSRAALTSSRSGPNSGAPLVGCSGLLGGPRRSDPRSKVFQPLTLFLGFWYFETARLRNCPERSDGIDSRGNQNPTHDQPRTPNSLTTVNGDAPAFFERIDDFAGEFRDRLERSGHATIRNRERSKDDSACRGGSGFIFQDQLGCFIRLQE